VTITIAGEASRRYALQLHLADATPGAIRASLDGLDFAATCAAGVLEVGRRSCGAGRSRWRGKRY